MSTRHARAPLHGRQGINGLNGHQGPARLDRLQIRLVANIKLDNAVAEGACILMLGDTRPELGAALTPADARKLAGALVEHAAALEAADRRIILPGEDLTG